MINLVVSQEGMGSTKVISLGKALAGVAAHLGHGVLHFVVPACESLPDHSGHCKDRSSLGMVHLRNEAMNKPIGSSLAVHDKEQYWRKYKLHHLQDKCLWQA